MKVPFLDLHAQNSPLRGEINAAMQEVIDASAFASGPFVKKFEDEFSLFCNCPFAVGVGSGTEAIWLTLLALGIGRGDEVITVPNTFIATAEAITFCGASPVFVDVDDETCTMDPRLIERAITPRTKALIPVHLYGQMADMDPILELARSRGLYVIEDACQAHGAEYRGRKAGSMGDAGCFSFYPGKNLGAFGEAGAVVTKDMELARKIETLRDHGQPRKYHHTLIGWNARMDGIQAAVLRVKLRHLYQWNSRRRAYARIYDQLFEDLKDIAVPKQAADRTHVYHLYVIRAANRNQIMATLGRKGIGCGIHYPVPLHLQEAYASLGLKSGAFPVAERCAEEALSLPIYPELTVEQIAMVAREVREALQPEKEACEAAV